MVSTQVAIIGAGPIGLELAVALKKAGIDYLHFEAGQIGQTISWYPRQVQFFSSPERIAIAGVPLQTADQSKATREEYLAYLRAVVQMFDLDVRTYQRVVGIERSGDLFILRTQRGGQEEVFLARRIVLAIGDMHLPRLLHIPGEDLPHVSHYFEDPHPYFRKRLLIVGGRNSAVEAAIRCQRAGAQVSISYRQPSFDEHSIKYWLLPEIKALIKAGKVGFYPLTLVRRITPAQVTLERLPESPVAGTPPMGSESAVHPENLPREPGAGDATSCWVASGDLVDVPADFVLLMTGYRQDTTLFEMAGLELEGGNRAPVMNSHTMETSVPGIHVIGTAAAGTQDHFRLFIENCHVHVTRVLSVLTGGSGKALRNGAGESTYFLPES